MQLPIENHSHLETDSLYKSTGEIDSTTIQEFQKSVSNGFSPQPTQTQQASTALQRFWQWTGFSETTLVNWIQIVSSIAIPVLLGYFGLQYDIQQAERTSDNQRSELMTKYYERMKELLVDDDMRNPEELEAQSMGRAMTLSTFRQLDGERKGELLKFLYDSQLIGGQCQPDSQSSQPHDCSIVNLNGAKLEKTTFDVSQHISLPNADLESASLKEAILPKIQLTGAKMNRVNLSKANLSEALLEDTQMEKAILTGAKLTGALLPRANLSASNLQQANLQGTNLKEANLEKADLQGADLRGADLTGASLIGAKLRGALYDSETKFPINPNPGFINPTDSGMIQK